MTNEQNTTSAAVEAQDVCGCIDCTCQPCNCSGAKPACGCADA
jgi:hypothetical protein